MQQSTTTAVQVGLILDAGPALKKKRQQPAEVSDKLPGLEERETKKRGKEEKRR